MSAVAPPQPSSPGDPRILEWFRPDLRRRLYRAWGVGGLFVVIGALATGGVFTHLGATFDPGVFGLLGAGLAFTVLGMAIMIVASMRVLGDERCLVVRSDGVRFDVRDEPGRVVAWERIDSVSVDPDDGALCIATDGADGARDLRIPLRFDDIDNAALAERLMATRRKALMGITLR